MKKANSILKPNIKIKILSDKLKIVPMKKKHISKDYISWLKNKKINKYLEIRHQKITYPGIINYINGLRSNKNLECFAIENENCKHIGNIFITKLDTINKVSSYGILVGDDRSRLAGYGFFASLLIIEFMFKKLKINKILGSCISDNYSSWKLLETIGFSREGHITESAYKTKNSFYDSYIYGLLKKDWKNKRKKFYSHLKKIRYQ